MIHLVENKTGKEDFKRYQKLTPKTYKQCVSLAKNLKNRKILHISSTPEGGGVAEILKSQVPIEKCLGLDSRWFYIKAPKKFFEITKEIHNRLQGRKGSLTEREKDFYFKQNKILAVNLRKIIKEYEPDIIVIHDPQPLPAIEALNKKILKILRIHIDLSAPDKAVLKMLRKYILKYDFVVITESKYRPEWLSKNKTIISMPAIDPFTPKNRLMPKIRSENILKEYGINTKKPVIAQVSRFDPWKDQFGTIKAYRMAKKEISDLQLILVGFIETLDDPESLRYYHKIKKYANDDPDIFLFADLKAIKEPSDDPLISAVYTCSDVIIQKSIREGFGIVVTEAMWKKKPVIGGKATGIELQIKDGVNGFLVTNSREAANLIIKLMNNSKLRKKIGKEAYKTVKEKFLMPRLTLDFLRVYKRM